MAAGFEHIRIDDPTAGVRRITLARPDRRNAQSPDMLYEIDDALTAASGDDEVHAIVLAADGPDFSSGHDLQAGFTLPRNPVATMEGRLEAEGVEGFYAFECEAYLGLCRRWRELPKPTIAQVQGRVIAGGLMLIWPMDLIIAADNASFADPVVAFGVNGCEYFAHVFELGARRAKEVLFTGDPITAAEANQAGMVNRVVPLEDLERTTLEIAERIVARPPFGLRLAKASVNRSQDAQGLQQAMDAAYGHHSTGHANCLARYGRLGDPGGAEVIRKTMKRKP